MGTLLSVTKCHNQVGIWPFRNSILSSRNHVARVYDSFGIHVKGEKADKLTFQRTSQDVTKINNYFESTVAKALVKEQYALKDASTTNGPQAGTISQKT